MVKDKNKNQEEGLREVEEVLTKTEQFLENHLNLVLYVIGGLIVIVLGILGVHKYYVSPKSVEAQEQIFGAQNYFSVDSFDLALNGDGVSLGFIDIIEDYASTDAGNLAKYYAGISYLHLGEYESAIKYLGQFSTDDLLLEPMAQSAIGDAYVELNDYNKAISAYKKALAINENEFTTPVIMTKMGLVYEALNENEKALKTYEKIKADFPKNSDAINVEKSIARLMQ
jgi:tetratricopeptide (TPR) repeat protein